MPRLGLGGKFELCFKYPFKIRDSHDYQNISIRRIIEYNFDTNEDPYCRDETRIISLDYISSSNSISNRLMTVERC